MPLSGNSMHMNTGFELEVTRPRLLFVFVLINMIFIKNNVIISITGIIIIISELN